MSQKNDTITVNIDNKLFQVEKGLTILQAAEKNDIYIPTLCAHKDLTPYGGCRVCLVEVEGARGFLTSCTTPAEDGMIIRTHTDQIQKERREIVKLMLSEHTSSCLICDEREECKKSMSTIRKVGVITGCRYCPNDDQCELQRVVEWLDIREINYPVYYRNLRVEKEDPFYDRDYNLCILCGRCVRVCHEVRNANTLAFKQRGRNTIIGPAFARTHLDAGCEFCGACVSICPTGALAEKSRKWDGAPEREVMTTCALCGVGCQMNVLVKGDKVIGSLPAEDRLVNDGQLCVKGRFCVNELVNDYQRLKKPARLKDGAKLNIKWEEAIDLAAEKLSQCAPEKFSLLISPNCTNEDLYIAQKFARTVMGSHQIDTSARLFYGNGFNDYLKLMKRSVPLADILSSSVVLCIGLDMRYGRSVVGVQLRKALSQGIQIISIHPRGHSLSLSADKWLQPTPNQFAPIIDVLADLIAEKNVDLSKLEKTISTDDLNEVADMLRNAVKPVILVGSEFMQHDDCAKILQGIDRLANHINAGILPLPAQNNLYGSLLMGAYPELLPGGHSSKDVNQIDNLNKTWNSKIHNFENSWTIQKLFEKGRLDVLYLIGEDIHFQNQEFNFMIYQNIYPSKNAKADLSLPATAFTETNGTFFNGEGRLQQVNKAVNPPGEALPDWKILCRIAQKMGVTGFDYENVSAIQKEIAQFVANFKTMERTANQLPSDVNLVPVGTQPGKNGKYPYLLTVTFAEHVYRGTPLTNKVEGLSKIIPVEMVVINNLDAENAGIAQGDEIIVTSAHFEQIFPVWITKDQPRGTLNVTVQEVSAINPNPHYVNLRRKDV